MRLSKSRFQFTILATVFLMHSGVSYANEAEEQIEKKAAQVATPAVERGAVDPKVPAVAFGAEDVWDVDIFDRDDHKVLVIQDRKFIKAGLFELGVHGGVFAASPFYRSFSGGGSAAYHFNEYFALNVFGDYSTNSLSEEAKQIDEFTENFGLPTRKEFQEPKFFGGASVVWSPIYGKFAFFRQRIIHFDMYGQLGASVLTSKTNVPANRGGKDQTLPGLLSGVGMRVFLSQRLNLRLDVRNSVFRTEFAPVAVGQEGSKVTRSKFQYTIGISTMLGSPRTGVAR